MYKLRADSLKLKSSYVAYGETKNEVIAKMLQHLQLHHPDYIGRLTVDRMAELDKQLLPHIEEVVEE
jgi:hypothetical protein